MWHVSRTKEQCASTVLWGVRRTHHHPTALQSEGDFTKAPSFLPSSYLLGGSRTRAGGIYEHQRTVCIHNMIRVAGPITTPPLQWGGREGGGDFTKAPSFLPSSYLLGGSRIRAGGIYEHQRTVCIHNMIRVAGPITTPPLQWGGREGGRLH